MRILYVEDNPANLYLVKRVARAGNHEVINHVDGEKALRDFDRIQPDLVLMDVQLAGEMNGLDVVRELRGRGVQTPIIAVTAYAMVGDRERCMEAGCTDYLAKPLPIARLLELFAQYTPDAPVASASPDAPVASASPDAPVASASPDEQAVAGAASAPPTTDGASTHEASTREAPAHEASTREAPAHETASPEASADAPRLDSSVTPEVPSRQQDKI